MIRLDVSTAISDFVQLEGKETNFLTQDGVLELSSLLISPSSMETQVSRYTSLPTLDLLIEGSMDTKPQHLDN